MSVAPPLQTYVVQERFDRALKSIRGALHEMEIEVLDEFEMPQNGGRGDRKSAEAKILLVSCPILDFEAVVLGRAGAVFFPLHVFVSSEQERTRVSVVNPATIFDARLPAGAADPMDRLVARVTLAMDSLT